MPGLLINRIGDLYFAAGTRSQAANIVEDAGSQNVTANDGEVCWCYIRCGLFNHGRDLEETGFYFFAIYDAVLICLVAGYGFDGDDCAFVLFVQVDHLSQDARFVSAEVVRQNHGKRVIAYKNLASQDCMTQSQHLFLTCIGYCAAADDAANIFEQYFFRRSCDLVLKFIGNIEVVLDSAFATAGYHPDVCQLGFNCFLNAILDQGFVDDGQHFLRHSFGCRQETGAIAGCWEQAFTYLGHQFPLPYKSSNLTMSSSPR